jgi:Zn-dependent protease with chaperone function
MLTRVAMMPFFRRPVSRSICAGALLLIVSIVAARVSAAPPPAADHPPSAAPVDSQATAADSLAAPAAVSEPPPAPRDYLAELRAGFTREDQDYARLKTIMRVVRPLVAVAISVLILFSGVAAGMRDIAHALGHRLYARLLVFLILFTTLAGVLQLPLEWYDGYVLEHRFGLSTQTFGAWFGDQGKTALVNVVAFGVVPILALMWVAIRRWPRTWWLALALGALPLLLAGTLLQPLVVDPLFNKFTPLRDRRLAGEILALAARAGIPARNVYQVDKSAQTRKINAYVSGFGASQRIVLWDTTLEAMHDDEILFVTGHEIGHYKLGHIWKGILFTAAFGLVLLFAAQRVCAAALRRFGARWGVHAMDDVAALPLLVAAVGLLAFLSQPVVNAYSREIESQSDVYGLEITHDNDSAARAFLALARLNRSDPDPPALVKWMLYSHPPAVERVQLALHYRPWTTGTPGRYVR